ncbi:MAG: (2Fe-2S)-binding protein [Gemmatimonadetes bacterium]|nr:(2Fe-2S)-binding protein [Gemmatimonadota bacterium]
MAKEARQTVTCTIDGRPVTVPKGVRIIEAAEQAGIGISHYCYHPGLSAPAMCRMCLVEVQGAPKLVPACVTTVTDGQVVLTESEKAREARTGVLEFYLYNHPLDCPVCDASGECKLQDYVFAEGRKHGRSFEAKRVLGQDDLGGDVAYDGDRCIMCTRCVRFMREIAGDDLLCVVQRGDRSVIDTFFERGLEASAWASNVIDICPVGALLSKDFLHKARAWDLDRTPSLCPNCAQGCNIDMDTRDNLVMRLRPRANPEVNSYWMCDYGRYRYEWFNLLDRVEEPMVRGPAGRLVRATWQEAVLGLVERLKVLRGETRARALAVASPFHANEDAGLLGRLLAVLGGGEAVFRSPRAEEEVVCPGFPRLARRRDLAANVRGLEAMGFRRVGDAAGTGGLDDEVSGKADVILVLGDPLADAAPDWAGDAALFVYLGAAPAAAAERADFVLPITQFAEQEGTFTNFEGRVQRFWPARQGPPLARPAWHVLGVVLAGLGDGVAPASAGHAFRRLSELYDEFAGLSYAQLGAGGALLNQRARLAAGSARGAEVG